MIKVSEFIFKADKSIETEAEAANTQTEDAVETTTTTELPTHSIDNRSSADSAVRRI